MKIAILDDYQDSVRHLSCFALLQGYEVVVFNDSPPQDVLIDRLQDVDALVLIRERTVIDEPLLSALPKLKVISQTGKVSNHIDVDLCAKYGVEVLEGRGSPVAPAELTWALIMASSRHIVPYAKHLEAGRWQHAGALGLGRALKGLTLGIWGFGKIGRRVAEFGRAFEMQVLVWGSDASRQLALDSGFLAADSKLAFFSAADILSLHLRLTPQTRGCVELADLAQMKPDALLVNTSRAELIRPGALAQALDSGQPGFAALDVFEQEPLPAGSAWCQRENVLATPHLGYVEQGGYELYFRIAFENLLAFDLSR
ncbi:MAG: D-2-hydroxyacid dehydrogenase family protein [Gammaproteobacteria bacterium]|nr:D-2-hydroxyacid dehydrogenase family protein [Gammaproteobacteria bacterium]